MDRQHLRRLLKEGIVQILDQVLPAFPVIGNQLGTRINKGDMTSPPRTGIEGIGPAVSLFRNQLRVVLYILVCGVEDVLLRRPELRPDPVNQVFEKRVGKTRLVGCRSYVPFSSAHSSMVKG